jgi:integrase
MARGLHLLTATHIKNAKAGTMLNDGGGLTLRVAKDGGGRWSYRFKLKGHPQREMGLGAYPAITLALAREKAKAARECVAKGIDPILEAERAAEAARAALEAAKANTMTFGRYADEMFLPAALTRIDNDKSRQRLERTFKTYAVDLRDKKVADINREDVLSVLRPIWSRIPVSAAYAREYIERLFRHAIQNGYYRGNNPAAWENFNATLAPPQKRPVKHHAAIPHKEIAAFIRQLRTRQADHEAVRAALLLELIILTAARTSEIRLAVWSEVNMASEPKTLTVPRVRLKNRRHRTVPHVIPLTPRMIEVLEQAWALAPVTPTPDAFIFPGYRDGKPLSEMACAMLMRRMGYGDYTVHGARSTFKTWAFTSTNFARELVEDQLTHEMGEVEAAYVRAAPIERRLELLEAWEKHLGSDNLGGGADEPVTTAQDADAAVTGNVVRFPVPERALVGDNGV